jgi:hypothetical protein
MNRKELIRQYKETPRPMGVYRVRNARSGRSLVGSSPDLRAILNRHQAQLELGVHTNAELQRDWNDLGAAAFHFEVLDTLEPLDGELNRTDRFAELRALEEMWIEKLRPTDDLGYTRGAATKGES